MRAFLMLLAIMVAACPALATDWRFLAAHADQSVALYYDRHSVREFGGVINVRVKRIFSEDEGREVAAEHGFADVVAYTVERVALDCGRGRIARQGTAWFGVGGKLLDRVVTSGYAWRDMRPGGLGETVCEALD